MPRISEVDVQAENLAGGAAYRQPLAGLPCVSAAESPSVADVTGLDLTDTTDGEDCLSEGIRQAVRAGRVGGVSLAKGGAPRDAARGLSPVTVRTADGTERDVAPAAPADLGDGGNNVFSCLDAADTGVSLSIPAGVLTDPNDDLTPAISGAVRPGRGGGYFFDETNGPRG